MQKKPRYTRVTSAGPGHKSSLVDVEQKLRQFPDIRARLFKLDALISQIRQFHYSPIVEDSHVVSIRATLMKRFRPFYGEAWKLFSITQSNQRKS
jgi:hypothetical protein